MAESQNTGELESKIKNKIEQYNLYEKELMQLELKNESFRKEIIKKVSEITNYQKQFGRKAQISQDNYKNVTKATAMITLEEQILKEFSSIQQRCNLNLQEKYKLANIERLVAQQKELNISYIILKKLDIKEDFYINNKIIEVPNLFENLKSISKIGKLNYDSLKNCGPYLVFRLTSDSKFVDVKQKACSVWGLPDSSYSLYDDMFISMECVNEANIQSYFSFYQPVDSTLPPGHSCFYLMEKLKNQKSLLESHNRTLDKVDSGSDSNNNKGSNIGTDLENCINKIEEEQILKGINSYKRIPTNPVKEYKKTVALIDNNVVFLLLTLLIFVLSIYATQQKKSDILQWSNNNQIIFNLIKTSFVSPPPFQFDYVNNFINQTSQQTNIGLQIYDQIIFRFFRTYNRTCSKFKGEELNNIYKTLSDIACYHSDFVDTNINKNILQTINFRDTINITHTINNAFGKISNAGGNVVLANKNNLETQIYNLDLIIIQKEVQGFEFQMVVYDMNIDVFTSICILYQKNLLNEFTISELHTIPFMTNIYENDITLKAIDITRLILLIVMLSCIVLSIIQKFLKDKHKTLIRRLLIVVITLFKIKYLLLIFSFAFMAAGFGIFNKYNLNSIDFVLETSIIDFYSYATSQKTARNYDLISLYLIFIFLLKYLQFLPYIKEFYKTLKRAAFELFFLFFIILIILLSLSYLTFYVYGIYFEEYSTFSYSLISNIKILLFVENNNLRKTFITELPDYAIVVFLIYTLLIRYFLLLLPYPIIIEYLRIQLDKSNSLRIVTTKNAELSFKDKLILFFTSCKFFKGNLKGEIEKEKKESRKTTEQIQIKAVDALLERTTE